MKIKVMKKLTSFVCIATFVVTSVLFLDLGVTKVQASDYNPVYRLYNVNTGEHFYTTNEVEYEYLQANGWSDEGIGWYGSNSGEPVYRLYNPNATGGDHYYTLSRGEAEFLIAQGWSIDNNWSPAFYSSGSTNLYVAYNPNAQSGAHNYTTNGMEQNVLLNSGWMFGEVAWKVMAPGTNYTDKVAVDCNVTTDGGGEGNNPGSFRWLYGDRTYDPGDLSGQVPEVDFYGDVQMTGYDDDYAVQFVIGGSESKSGQIGVTLHYQAGSDYRYAQGRINVTNINFPANSNSTGQQYYSVNTSAPRITNGQKVRLNVKYYSSGFMQTYVDGVLVGQYRTKLNPTQTSSMYSIPWDASTHGNRYILHVNADTNCTVSNIQVLRRGQDYTNYGTTILNAPESSYGFNKSSYDVTNKDISAIY